MKSETIGPFKKISLLGKGSFAEVYLCLYNGKLYAIKCIDRERIEANHQFMTMLEREKEILEKLSTFNCPYLATLYPSSKFGLADSDDTIYLIFDYYNGGDIQSLLKFNKPIPEEIVQHFTKQLVEGLFLLHSNNIIHRDLKPANIMIHYENESNKGNYMMSTLKISDFGFARELDDDGFATSILGTPYYMDPKIFTNYANGNKYDYEEPLYYDQKVDVWSLGAMVFQMLTGKLPFTSSDKEQMKKKLEKGHYVIPGNVRISDEAISFLKCCLQNINEKRADIQALRTHPFIELECSMFKYNFHENHVVQSYDNNNEPMYNDFSLSTYQFTQDQLQGYEKVEFVYKISNTNMAKQPCKKWHRLGELNVFFIIEHRNFFLMVSYPGSWAQYGYKRVSYIADIIDVNKSKANESSGDIEFPINKGKINVKTTAFHKILFTMPYNNMLKYSKMINGKYQFNFLLKFKLLK